MPVRRTLTSSRSSDSNSSQQSKTRRRRLAKRAMLAVLLGAVGTYSFARPQWPLAPQTTEPGIRVIKKQGVHSAIHHRLRLNAENVAVFRASGAIEREEALHHECLEDRFGLATKAESPDEAIPPSAESKGRESGQADGSLHGGAVVSSEPNASLGSTAMHLSDTEELSDVVGNVSKQAQDRVVEKSTTLAENADSSSTAIRQDEDGSSKRGSKVLPRRVEERLATERRPQQRTKVFDITTEKVAAKPSASNAAADVPDAENKDVSEQVVRKESESESAENQGEPERIQYSASAKPPQMLLSGSRRRLGDRIKRLVRGDETNQTNDGPKAEHTQQPNRSRLSNDSRQSNASRSTDSESTTQRVARSIPPTALRDPGTPEMRQESLPSQTGLPEDNPVLMLLEPNANSRQSSAGERTSSPPSYALESDGDPLSLTLESSEPSTRVDDLSKVEEQAGSNYELQLSNEPLETLESWAKGDDVSEVDGKECPGAPDGTSEMEHQPDDIDVEQDSHPYDAPAAKSIEDSSPTAPPALDFSEREIQIHNQINRTLNYFMENPETVVRRGPWALMHATLPFGVETEIIAGNRRVNAIGWMCYNGVCARQRMFQATRSGFRTNVGPGVQGHEGQFLAILAQSKVSSDYPIKIGKRQHTIADLVRYEMSTCRERSELTFKLIGLSYYLEPDQRWRDNRGHYWTLEKMAADELSQPVNGVACGGTHRLMGLSFAIIERQRAGLPITGTWARAEAYLNDYVNYTMTLQNPDGSFSTNWFEGRGNKQDMERKVQTTGHMLEWLIYTLPDDYLRSPRIQVSVEYLLNSVGARPGYDWPIGPRGHALRALALYNQRVFGAEQGSMKRYIATHPDGPSIR